MKVKPNKVTHSFCPNCKKDVKFKVDWMGVKENTPKGIITYKELYAICPHCDEEIYVSAVNDVNVARREKAFAELVKTQMQSIPTDLISRKQCLDTFYDLFVMEKTRIAEATEEEIFKLQHTLGTTPSVDIKPVRHGFWEQGDYYDIGDVCSECQYDSCHEPCKYKYCPNCGARMDGGK